MPLTTPLEWNDRALPTVRPSLPIASSRVSVFPSGTQIRSPRSSGAQVYPNGAQISQLIRCFPHLSSRLLVPSCYPGATITFEALACRSQLPTISPSISATRLLIMVFVSKTSMATTEKPKVATEEAKIDLFEDDDEFEEFDIDKESNTRALRWFGLR